MVALRSDAPVDFLESDALSSVVSHTQVEEGSNSKIMAVYKCQETNNRLEITIRTIEGTHGKIEAFIIPRADPKTCSVSTFIIKPLSLHQRVFDFQPKYVIFNICIEM